MRALTAKEKGVPPDFAYRVFLYVPSIAVAFALAVR
jgi:hypothetical protein